MSTYRKSLAGTPDGYADWEAAGLRWLGQAASTGGAATVEVIEVTPTALVLESLTSIAPTREDAKHFGQELAATHLHGAPAFGAPPPGWIGTGWLGPAQDVLSMPVDPSPTWGAFYAQQRILHTLALGRQRGLWSGTDGAVFEAAADRIQSGVFDDGTPPARLHGDLWSGNLMWTERGCVLIDPAAHGGHPETDLAMLALFGAPHLETIVSAYLDVNPLSPDWRSRIGLHQLHPVMMHAVLFGGGYLRQAYQLAGSLR